MKSLRDPCLWAFFAFPLAIVSAYAAFSGFPEALAYYLAYYLAH